MQGYGAPPPRPAPATGSSSMVLFIVLGVVGVLILGGIMLVVLGIYGTRKYISQAKAAEARSTVNMIAVDAETAFDKPAYGGYGTYGAYGGGSSHKLCPSASRPVPASITEVRGKKYASGASDWDVDRVANGGFYCLKFEMWEPQYYQYDYRVTGPGFRVGDTFSAEGRGDLDGDGRASIFTIVGTVETSSTVRLGRMTEVDPGE
jgi:hypothetical protein